MHSFIHSVGEGLRLEVYLKAKIFKGTPLASELWTYPGGLHTVAREIK